MDLPLVIVDSNVLVSGLMRAESPPARVVGFLFSRRLDAVLSLDLLREYRVVLLRERVRRRTSLNVTEVDAVLEFLREAGVMVEPNPAPFAAPDPGDQHLWDLLAELPGAILVTGDRRLLGSPDYPGRVLSPPEFVEKNVPRS